MMVAVIYGWFENLIRMFCDFDTSHPADKLLGFAAEHTAADNFDPTILIFNNIHMLLHVCVICKRSILCQIL